MLLTKQAVVAASVALGALGLSAPAVASAAAQQGAATGPALHAPQTAVPARPDARPPLPAGEHYSCPAPVRPGQMTCMSIVRSAAAPGATSTMPAAPLANGPYSPADLLSAYKLATYAARNGGGRTIAIVDAFSDPSAAADLARYRAQFHLPACATSSGCLRIVNERGQSGPLPRADKGWAFEESLDLDMVSAICPKCHILLVEGRTPSPVDLGIAEDTAVAKGAKYVSNSWSGLEFPGQDAFDHYFNHPGVAIDFASGDNGFGPAYPTDLQYVTAVGGTTLTHASNGRGWAETAWGPGSASDPGATGSGCSALEAKPSWQHADAIQPTGCLNRTENDVAAVANENTGVFVYDSYQMNGANWHEAGGTSASTPIITGAYALAGTPARGTYPAEYPYLRPSHLFDVAGGANGTCEPNRQYLCHAVAGYDGPTGLGTPDGTGAFTNGGIHRVTLVDPGTQDVRRGAKLALRIVGLDTSSVSALRYSATGLPAGLSIHSVAHSLSGQITGTLPSTPGSFRVTVTAKDGSATGTTRFTIVISGSLTGTSTAGAVSVSHGTWCLDDSSGTAVRIRSCSGAVSQHWLYLARGGPDDVGSLRIAGLCLGLSGTNGVLASCNGSASQQWEYLGFGVLGNLAARRCLNVPTLTAGAQVGVAACTGSTRQTWVLPAGEVVSAAGGRCLDDPGDSSSAGTVVEVNSCGAAEDNWTLRGDGTIRSATGLCLSTNGSMLTGAAAVIEPCVITDLSQLWLPSSGGQLFNVNSGKCLSDPANGGSGTALVQGDCYGQAGEVWGLN